MATIRPDADTAEVRTVVRGEGVPIAAIYEDESEIPPTDPAGTVYLIADD